MKESAIIEVLFRDKPFMVLSALRSNNGKINAAKVSREAKCTYSHTCKILKLFEENSLISVDRSGRRPAIGLMEKGSQLAEEIEKIKEILNSNGRKY